MIRSGLPFIVFTISFAFTGCTITSPTARLRQSTDSAILSPSRSWVTYADPVEGLDMFPSVHVMNLAGKRDRYNLGRVTGESWLRTSDILWFRRDPDTISRLDVGTGSELRIVRPNDPWSFVAVAGLTTERAAVVELKSDDSAERLCIAEEHPPDRCVELAERGIYDVRPLDNTNVVVTRVTEAEGSEIRVLSAETLRAQMTARLSPGETFVDMAREGSQDLIISHDQSDRLTFATYRGGERIVEAHVDARSPCGMPHIGAFSIRAAAVEFRDERWFVVMALPLEGRWREYQLNGGDIECHPFHMIN